MMTTCIIGLSWPREPDTYGAILNARGHSAKSRVQRDMLIIIYIPFGVYNFIPSFNSVSASQLSCIDGL